MLSELLKDFLAVSRWVNRYSVRTLLLYIIYVLIIRTSKHFWLLQFIGHQTRVKYLWYITTCSYWNHCILSQELLERKFLVLKNGLIFYRFLVEWVFLLHKMTIKGLIAIINQSILTISQPKVGLWFIWSIIKLHLSFCEEETLTQP